MKNLNGVNIAIKWNGEGPRRSMPDRETQYFFPLSIGFEQQSISHVRKSVMDLHPGRVLIFISSPCLCPQWLFCNYLFRVWFIWQDIFIWIEWLSLAFFPTSLTYPSWLMWQNKNQRIPLRASLNRPIVLKSKDKLYHLRSWTANTHKQKDKLLSKMVECAVCPSLTGTPASVQGTEGLRATRRADTTDHPPSQNNNSSVSHPSQVFRTAPPQGE